MKTSYKGMKISESEWKVFFGHAAATMQYLEVPEQERTDVLEFVSSLKKAIVEC